MDMKEYNLNYKLLAKKVKYLRQKNNWTQEKLAEKLDKSLNFVSKLEIAYNKTSISLDTLIKLANLFEIDINFFLQDNFNTNSNDIDIILSMNLNKLEESEKEFLINIIRDLELYKLKKAES